MAALPKSKVKEYLKSQLPNIRENERKLRDLITEIEMLDKAGIDTTDLRDQWQRLVDQFQKLKEVASS